MKPLPIDPFLPSIVDTVRSRGALVLMAETGAGKTTRLPRALLDAGLAGERKILVLEPRRIAARLAARFVAAELGEAVGETVGYRVRFERKSTRRTRLEFITEGILVRRLIGDPLLKGVGAVVIDEFHERHLDTDTALAFVTRLRRARPDLRLIVMSATMDPEPVSRFIDGPVMNVPGREHPIEIIHDEVPDARPLERRVLARLRGIAAEGPVGGVLVFLPGVREIRRAHRLAEDWARGAGVSLFDLYGNLSRSAQDRALRDRSPSKVVFATNVAESSVTIEGIDTVIDSGWAREAGASPWSGLPTLDTRRISKRSALQRAGRAGRIGPGRCFRLYTRQEYEHAPEDGMAEIQRVDISQLVLEIAAMGLRADDIAWFESPSQAALERAYDLLERLGALDEGRSVTARGRRMAHLPLHPRQAALVIEADDRGSRRRGALMAALLGVRGRSDGAGIDTREQARSRADGPSDLLLRAEEFERFEEQRALRKGREIDIGTHLQIARVREQVLEALSDPDVPIAEETGDEQSALISTLRAYPDRVARRRKARAPFFEMARGDDVRLSPSSIVRQAEFVVAVDAVSQEGGETIVHAASAIEKEWLIELFPEKIETRRQVLFESDGEGVVAYESLLYDGIALETKVHRDCRDEETAAILTKEILRRGLDSICSKDALERWKARLDFAHSLDAAVDRWEDLDLAPCVELLCMGRRTLDEVRALNVLGALKGLIGRDSAARIERLAPDHVVLASGKKVRVEYRRGKTPAVGAFLQEFFGMSTGPTIGGGKVPLVLELLAPNRRALQVTRDLGGFWQRHYPALRRRLMRRYSRHAWPEDPKSAKPHLLAKRSGKRRKR